MSRILAGAFFALATVSLGIAACQSGPTTAPSARSVRVPPETLASLPAPTSTTALRSASAFVSIADKDQRSAAIFLEMGKVLTHARCVNCHPRTDRPLQGDTRVVHNPPVTRGPAGHGVPAMECTTCHGPKTVAFANGVGSIPGNPKWALAPIEMAWEGKTVGEICQQLRDPKRSHKTLEELHEHNAHDGLVGYGWDPGPGRTPAPGTQQEFGDLTRAWIDAGASCPA